ncbi:MAG: hypothetical protein AAGI01_05455 [Myxococcota bacterium]
MTLTFLSGAAGISDNALLFDVHGARLLVDLGHHGPGDVPAWMDSQADLGSIHAAAVSHAHADHLGALAACLQRRPSLPVFTSAPTRDLTAFAITPRARDRPHARSLAESLTALPFDAPQPILGGALRLTLLPCGHMLGAASLLLDSEHSSKFPTILVLPDFCLHAQSILPGALLPEAPVDTLVMEGTLAIDRSADAIDYAAESARLVEVMRAHPGAPRLLAAAPLGEGPEVAHILRHVGEPVVAHRYMQPVFEAYRRHTSEDFAHVTFADSAGCRAALLASRIVLAMGAHFEPHAESGRLAAHVEHRADALLILFNGARARRAPSGALVHRAQRFVLPTHAPRWALLEAVRRIAPRRVVLYHGPHKGLHALAKAIRKEGAVEEVVVPRDGEVVGLYVAK